MKFLCLVLEGGVEVKKEGLFNWYLIKGGKGVGEIGDVLFELLGLFNDFIFIFGLLL